MTGTEETVAELAPQEVAVAEIALRMDELIADIRRIGFRRVRARGG